MLANAHPATTQVGGADRYTLTKDATMLFGSNHYHIMYL